VPEEAAIRDCISGTGEADTADDRRCAEASYRVALAGGIMGGDYQDPAADDTC
jgi:hypothetical protein